MKHEAFPARVRMNHRRKANMLKKASEYSKMCDADVCVGIRMRETGQVHILDLSS
jgi:hypothetical protein